LNEKSNPLLTQESSTARRIFSVVGALVGLSLIAVVLGIMIRTSPTAPPIPVDPDQKPPLERLADTRAEAERLRTTYGWVDEEQGIVRIPLDVAIDRLIAEQDRPRDEYVEPESEPGGR
jgi:hypothetical protein